MRKTDECIDLLIERCIGRKTARKILGGVPAAWMESKISWSVIVFVCMCIGGGCCMILPTCNNVVSLGYLFINQSLNC